MASASVPCLALPAVLAIEVARVLDSGDHASLGETCRFWRHVCAHGRSHGTLNLRVPLAYLPAPRNYRSTQDVVDQKAARKRDQGATDASLRAALAALARNVPRFVLKIESALPDTQRMAGESKASHPRLRSRLVCASDFGDLRDQAVHLNARWSSFEREASTKKEVDHAHTLEAHVQQQSLLAAFEAKMRAAKKHLKQSLLDARMSLLQQLYVAQFRAWRPWRISVHASCSRAPDLLSCMAEEERAIAAKTYPSCSAETSKSLTRGMTHAAGANGCVRHLCLDFRDCPEGNVVALTRTIQAFESLLALELRNTYHAIGLDVSLVASRLTSLRLLSTDSALSAAEFVTLPTTLTRLDLHNLPATESFAFLSGGGAEKEDGGAKDALGDESCLRLVHLRSLTLLRVARTPGTNSTGEHLHLRPRHLSRLARSFPGLVELSCNVSPLAPDSFSSVESAQKRELRSLSALDRLQTLRLAVLGSPDNASAWLDAWLTQADVLPTNVHTLFVQVVEGYDDDCGRLTHSTSRPVAYFERDMPAMSFGVPACDSGRLRRIPSADSGSVSGSWLASAAAAAALWENLTRLDLSHISAAQWSALLASTMASSLTVLRVTHRADCPREYGVAAAPMSPDLRALERLVRFSWHYAYCAPSFGGAEVNADLRDSEAQTASSMRLPLSLRDLELCATSHTAFNQEYLRVVARDCPRLRSLSVRNWTLRSMLYVSDLSVLQRLRLSGLLWNSNAPLDTLHIGTRRLASQPILHIEVDRNNSLLFNGPHFWSPENDACNRIILRNWKGDS